MTILIVLLLTVVSTCLAQPADDNAKERSAREPQSQIQYSDPDGLKVDWKLYAPQNQWRAHLESSQRPQRAEEGTAKSDSSPKQQPVIVHAPIEVQPQYQPYSLVPNHIKQLIVDSYTPQGPYVDPGAFLYQTYIAVPVAAPSTDTKKDQSLLPQKLQLEQEYFNTATNYRVSENEAIEHPSKIQQIGRVPDQAGIKYKDEEKSVVKSSFSSLDSINSGQSQENRQYHEPHEQSQSGLFNKQNSHSQYQQYNNAASQSQNEAYYKQISVIESHLGQENKRDSQSQYGQYNAQASQPHSQYAQYNAQPSQPLSQYAQYNAQASKPHSQYPQYNKQAANSQSEYPQYKDQATQLQSQYAQYNKESAELPQYKIQPSNSQSEYPQYKKEASQLSQSNKQETNSQQYKQTSQADSIKPISQTNFDKKMPMAIKQLLTYQAQLPYNVIANHILYRPKQFFIPKPLPENEKFVRQYPSKIYYVKTDGQIYDSSEIGKVEENKKRH